MEINIDDLADKATIIVQGYAFLPTKEDYWQVVNLHNATRVAIIYKGEIFETNMNDSEISQVMMFYSQNKEFLGDSYAVSVK